MNVETIPVIIAAFSLIFAVVSFLFERKQTKSYETLNRVESLMEQYYEKLRNKGVNDHYADYVKYLGELDRFARGVNEGVYSKRIVKRHASIFLKMQYESFAKKLIADRRKQFGRESYYENIEQLIKEL